MTSQPTDIDQPSGSGESKRPADDQYTDEETARRRDAVVRRMLNTPPKPHKSIGKAKEQPASKGRAHKGKTGR